jgi:uncharacterized protein YbaR (Trm112 family)
MTIDRRLLDILCCPVTKVPVKPLSKDELIKLNEQIRGGNVYYVDGRKVEEPLDEGLITENGRTVYRVRAGIPVMLEEEGIGMEQLPAGGAGRPTVPA